MDISVITFFNIVIVTATYELPSYPKGIMGIFARFNDAFSRDVDQLNTGLFTWQYRLSSCSEIYLQVAIICCVDVLFRWHLVEVLFDGKR